MNEELTLRDATVQDIQLELIRRTVFNSFDGRKIISTLRQHRELWKAVILDQSGASHTCGLIKLRDLADNIWNTDTLYVLCRSRRDAETLARIADEEQWLADEVHVYGDQQQVGLIIGSSPTELGLVSFWWD